MIYIDVMQMYFMVHYKLLLMRTFNGMHQEQWLGIALAVLREPYGVID